MALFKKKNVAEVIKKRHEQTSQEKYRHLLLIDDEPNNLTVLADFLGRHYTVHTAESGQEGLELLKQFPICLIITDQRMPEMTGVEFLQESSVEHPDTVRIILTGYSDMDDIVEAINTCGIYRYITKPWDENELLITVKRALELFDLEEQNRQLVKELSEKNESLEEKVAMRTQALMEANQKNLNLHQDLLKRFLAPPVAEKFCKALKDSGNNDFLKVTTKRKNMTVFFSDIRDFTQTTSQLEPEEVCDLVNDYFTEMNHIVEEFGGTLDKFIGDAVMVFFNDPEDQDDHPHRAINMAVAMQKRMKELESRWMSYGLESALKVGMGIATGYVNVGSYGSKDRLSYTTFGSHVNLAARLVGQAESNDILISHRTWTQVQDQIACTPLGSVEVKGFSMPVQHYRVDY